MSVANSSSQVGAEPFAIRGIKGLWWDGIANYNEALTWLVEQKLNFLMLCYTSFAASAGNWRSDYTPDEKEQIRDLAARAEAMGVNLCLAVNPSQYSEPPLVYASEEDYLILQRKLAGMQAIGVRWFALCLDDITRRLEPADSKEFGDLQSAHVWLVNRLLTDMRLLTPQPKLMFCPSAYTTYDAEVHPDYLRAIGDGIDPGVMIFWTGPIAYSPTITVDDAERFGALVRRKPFLWDNYPVNDFYAWRPCLAPLKNRSAELGRVVSGYVANPMKQWHASCIPLATAAAYLRDPGAYDPSEAMEQVVDSYTDDQRPAVRLLLELYGGSFCGEADFPRKPPLSNAAEAGKALPKYRLLRVLLSGVPALGGLCEDLRLTLERDIALLERTVAGKGATGWPVRLTGLDFDSGGAADFGYGRYGRTVNYIYARPTGREEMRAEFHIPVAPGNGAVLRLVARNGDGGPRARVQIVLNEWMAADSEQVFSGEDFEQWSWQIPDGVLSEGHNVITIRSVDMNGKLGEHPWFMLAEAEIAPLK